MPEKRYCLCAIHGCFFLPLLLPLMFPFSVLDVPLAAAATLNKTQDAILRDIERHVNSESASTRWNTTDSNPCLWRGIQCSNSGSSVISITLSNYGISNSSIFDSLCRLDSLQTLDLSRNSLTDLTTQFSSPSCSMKEGLRFLNLSSNQLRSKLSNLLGFPHLEVLDLSSNYFTSGNLSADSGSFPRLKSLNLSSNKLNGDVPTSMVDSLAELVLSGNQLSGSIPPGLFKYGNLTLLDLSQNQLTGTVPDGFKSLSKLETLLLSGNNLTGAIPPSLSNVTTLSRFAANQNNFTGLLHSWITQNVGMLDLSYNRLSAPIPPDFLSHQGLQTVDLTSNMLQGTIPSNFSQSLYRLRLGGNQLVGVIPALICDANGMPKMSYLELDNNDLTGHIPSELGNCKSLSLLNLASNSLEGQVPDQISKLGKLVVLKLQNNKLSGAVPSTFSDLTSLSTLNLSLNSFSGVIPEGIFKLPKLTNLYFQGNKISGAIPVSVSSSQFLIELNLGDNALSGTIPTMPTSVSTALLNLSHNHLSGSIPSNINSLSELEILDLSHNDLSGEVPPSLVGLQSLTELDLSYNKLSGSVPIFSKTVDIDIIGNPDLVNGMGNNNDTLTTGKCKWHNYIIIFFPISCALVGLCVFSVIAMMLFSKRLYRAQDERIPSGVAVAQSINGCLVTMNSSFHTNAIEYTKAEQDNWRITPFQALNFEVADILQGLREENLVGIGGSGHVYRVTYTNRHNSGTGVVAVKQIQTLGSLDEKLECEFESEASILCKIRHNNIVKVLCCLSSVESKLLVYDYMDNGSLHRWLHGDCVLRARHSMVRARPVQRVPLDWPTRLLVAVGAAQGLCYMHHDCSPPIVHRDVKTSNILLDSEFRAKVADFGVARMLVREGEPNTMSAVAGSFGYMAPEYAYTRKVNEKVDIYSFGVVLLELTTGKKANAGGELGCLAEWARHYYQSGADILELDVIDKSIRYAGYHSEIETVFRLGVQ